MRIWSRNAGGDTLRGLNTYRKVPKRRGKKTKSGKEGGRKDWDSSGSKTNATNNTQMRRADERRDGSISGTKEERDSV